MISKRTFIAFVFVLAVVLLFTGCQTVKTAEVVEPTTGPNAEPVQHDLSDPAALLESMMNQYEDSVFTQSGWLHMVNTFESDHENGIVFPDDTRMPSDYIWEGWFHINEEGKVVEHVMTYSDGENQVYQGSVFTEGTTVTWPWFNQYDDTEPHILYLDGGRSRMMVDGYERGLALSAEVDEIDGRAIVRFITHQRYDVLNYIGDSAQPVEKTYEELILDQATGAMIESKTIYILEDGTEELSQRQFNFTLEWAELPENLAKLLLDVQNDTFPEELILTPPPVTRENILERLAKFNERGAEQYLTPGWVRVLEDKFLFITDETGEPASDMVEVETYYLMGEEGEVLQYVSAGNDEIIVYQDKTFTNLLKPEEGGTGPEDFYLTSLDYGLVETIENNPDLELDMIEETMGIVTIVVTETYETETTFENGITAIGVVSSYQLNIADGTVMLIEQSYILPDGSNLAKAHIIIEAIEKIDVPPDYILGYLEE